MAQEIFICHSTKDKVVADAICDKLESAGLGCWIAPRDVAAGADWPEAIEDAIRNSLVMVLVFSSWANESKEVVRELHAASACSASVIPFRIEDVQPAKALAYHMRPLHWMEAHTPPLSKHLSELQARVQSLVSAKRANIDQVQSESRPKSESVVNPGEQEIQRGLWLSYFKRAKQATREWSLVEAQNSFNLALDIAKEMAKTYPHNIQWQYDLSRSHVRVGSVANALGDLAQAKRHYLEELEIVRGISELDPGNWLSHRSLADSYVRLGAVVRAQGNFEEAQEQYNRALLIAEKHARSSPGDNQWQRILSNCKVNLRDLEQIGNN